MSSDVTGPGEPSADTVHFGSRVFSVDLYPAPRVLALRGDLDDAASPVLRSAVVPLLESGDTRDVTVDLRPLRFLDSYGVSAVLSARSDLREHGSDVDLVVPDGQIAKVFAIVAPEVPTRVG